MRPAGFYDNNRGGGSSGKAHGRHWTPRFGYNSNRRNTQRVYCEQSYYRPPIPPPPPSCLSEPQQSGFTPYQASHGFSSQTLRAAQSVNFKTSDVRSEFSQDKTTHSDSVNSMKGALKLPLLPPRVSVPREKAQSILMMEDGIFDTEVEDVFHVHSLSDNYRVVDMGVCTCSCPAGENSRICSHLYAVAQQNDKLSFRFSLFTFVRWALDQESARHPVKRLSVIARRVEQGFITELSSFLKPETLVPWLLSSFCGLLVRVLQDKRGRLPMVSVDSGLYNRSSEERDVEHCFRRNVEMKLSQFIEKAQPSSDDLVERFITFFRAMGPAYRSSEKLLKLLQSKKAERAKHQPWNRRLRSDCIITIGSSDSSSDTDDSFLDVNKKNLLLHRGSQKSKNNDSFETLFKDVEAWLLHGTSDRQNKTLDDAVEDVPRASETNAIRSENQLSNSHLNFREKQPTFSWPLEQITSELYRLRPQHTSFISLLAALHDRFNPSNAEPAGVSLLEFLIAHLETDVSLREATALVTTPPPSKSKAESVLQDLQQVVSTLSALVPEGLNCSRTNPVYDAAAEFLEAFASLSPGLRTLGISLDASKKQESPGAVAFRDVHLIASFYSNFSLASHSNPAKSLSGVTELIEQAIKLIELAPFGVDLAYFIRWNCCFSAVLGQFSSFLRQSFPTLNGDKNENNWRLLEIGYQIFIKLPVSETKERLYKNLSASICERSLFKTVALCVESVISGFVSKEEIETMWKDIISAMVCSTNSRLWDQDEADIYRWTPRCYHSAVEWFLSLSRTQRPAGMALSTVAPAELINEPCTQYPLIGDPSNTLDAQTVDAECYKTSAPSCSNTPQVCEEVIENGAEGRDVSAASLSREDWNRLIQEIRQSEFGEGIEQQESHRSSFQAQKLRLNRAIKKVSEDLYANPSHLFFELLQNADDNVYNLKNTTRQCSKGTVEQVPTFCIINSEDGIAVANNEQGFRPKDLRSLCDVGASTKCCTGKDYVGKFGIGFKSVFCYTKTPYIFSNNLAVKFDVSDPSGIGYLLPIVVAGDWKDICPKRVVDVIFQTSNVRPTTVFWLPRDKARCFEHGTGNAFDAMKQLSPTCLLFLNRVRCVRLFNVDPNASVGSMTFFNLQAPSCSLDEHDANSNGFLLQRLIKKCVPKFKYVVLEQSLRTSTSALPITTNTASVQPTTSVSRFPFLVAFDDSNSLRVAYPLDAVSLMPTPSAMSFPVYVYLPVRSMGLRFAVHGDFFLAATREDLIIGHPENNQRLQHLSELIASSIATMAECLDPIALGFVPLASEVSGAMKSIVEPVLRLLKNALRLPIVSNIASINFDCDNDINKETCMVIRNVVLPMKAVIPSVYFTDHVSHQKTDTNVIASPQVYFQYLFANLICVRFFRLQEQCSVKMTTRSVVSFPFLRRASLSVCTERLKIPFFGPWDIIERLMVLERCLNATASLTEECVEECAVMLGGALILLDLCLEELDAFSAVLSCVKNLSIFPTQQLSKAAIGSEETRSARCFQSIPSTGNSPMVFQPRCNQHTSKVAQDAFSEQPFTVLHDAVFNWNTLLQRSETMIQELDDPAANTLEYVEKLMDIRLENVLERLGLVSMSGKSFMPKYIVPLLQSPDTSSSLLIDGLMYYVTSNIESVSSMLSSPDATPASALLSTFYCCTETPGSRPVRLDNRHALMTRTGYEQCIALCRLFQTYFEKVKNANTSMCDTLSDEPHQLVTLRTRRGSPSKLYWEKSALVAQQNTPTFWDDFFTFWGALPYLAPEPVHYRLSKKESGFTAELLVTPDSCPPYLNRRAIEWINQKISLNRFSSVHGFGGKNWSLDVVDYISLDFLLIVDLLLLYPLTTSSFPDISPVLTRLLEFLMPFMQPEKTAIQCLGYTGFDHSPSLDTVASAFTLQLRWSPWWPSTSVNFNAVSLAESSNVSHLSATNCCCYLRPPSQLTVYNDEHRSIAEMVNINTSEVCLTLVAKWWQERSKEVISERFDTLSSHFENSDAVLSYLGIASRPSPEHLVQALASLAQLISKSSQEGSNTNQKRRKYSASSAPSIPALCGYAPLLQLYWRILKVLANLLNSSKKREACEVALKVGCQPNVLLPEYLTRRCWCIAYNDSLGVWYPISLDCVFWCFPSKSSFSFYHSSAVLENMLEPIITSISDSNTKTCCLADFPHPIKQLFLDILHCSHYPSLDQILRELRTVTSCTGTSARDGSFSAQEERAHRTVRCLYILQQSLSALDEKKNISSPTDNLEAAKLMLELFDCAKSATLSSNICNSVEVFFASFMELRILPVMYNDKLTFSSLSYVETASSPLVVAVTDLDQRLSELWCKGNLETERDPCFQLAWGAFKTTGAKELDLKEQQWWNNWILRLAKKRTISSLFAPQYCGSSSVQYLSPLYAEDFSKSLTHLVFCFLLPLIIRYFSRFQLLLLEEFCQNTTPKQLAQRVSTIRAGTVASSVQFCWTLKTQLYEQGATTTVIPSNNIMSQIVTAEAQYFPNEQSAAPCILVTESGLYSSLSLKFLVEELLIDLFPFTASTEELSAILNLVSFLEDTPAFTCDAQGGFKFSERVETLLVTVADVPLLTRLQEYPDSPAAFLSSWYLELLSIIPSKPAQDFQKTFTIDFLKPLRTRLEKNNTVQIYDQSSYVIPMPHLENAPQPFVLVDLETQDVKTVFSSIVSPSTENKIRANTIHPSENEIVGVDPLSVLQSVAAVQEPRSEASGFTSKEAPNSPAHVSCGQFVGELLTYKKDFSEKYIKANALPSSVVMSIGRQGEQFVYNYLIDTYNSELQAGTVSIRWINDKTETGLPYDIVLEVSTDKYKPATEYFIEVKATRTRDKSFFEISHKEWCFAQMKGDHYFIFRAFGITTKDPSIIRIKNPYRQWKMQHVGMFFAF